jgi:hypothetical protein
LCLKDKLKPEPKLTQVTTRLEVRQPFPQRNYWNKKEKLGKTTTIFLLTCVIFPLYVRKNLHPYPYFHLLPEGLFILLD